MASTLAPEIAPDTVVTFEINPGTLLQLLEALPESGPRLKCFEGSVTLVSPGLSHESKGSRLDRMILAICLELGIKFSTLASTTWKLPRGSGDTAYEADAAYYIQSHGTAVEDQPPDLAIEIVVSHPEKKAIRAGAFLKIPEMWVLNIPKHQLTFYHLMARGPSKGTYRAQSKSRAIPGLTSADVLERIDDPEPNDATFHVNCQEWARQVLVPRLRARDGAG